MRNAVGKPEPCCEQPARAFSPEGHPSHPSAGVHEHGHTDVAILPEEGCGLGTEADAAVGGGVAHHGALVKAHAVIREALEVLHASRVIQIGAVVQVTLHDMKIARGGGFGSAAGADLEAQQHLLAVLEDAALIRQADDNVTPPELLL